MNKYVEHIIKDLVRDTRIDYENENIYFLSLLLSSFSSFSHLLYPLSHLPPYFFLSSYCKEKYGLTEDEIDYVWVQYKDIIKDKISKREP